MLSYLPCTLCALLVLIINFNLLDMGLKVDSDSKGKSKKMISMEMKREIIKKYKEGTHIVILSRVYGNNQSTIRRIIKKNEAIKASRSPKDRTILAGKRTWNE